MTRKAASGGVLVAVVVGCGDSAGNSNVGLPNDPGIGATAGGASGGVGALPGGAGPVADVVGATGGAVSVANGGGSAGVTNGVSVGSGGVNAGGAAMDANVAGSAGMANDPVIPGDCTVPPPPSELVGWASDGAGTTGGGDLAPVVVTNAGEFSANIGGTVARVIHLMGSITGDFDIGSNKTVIGVCDSEIRGHIGFNGASNTIVRNLRIIGNNCADSPNDCSSGADAVGVGGASDHIWLDHLDISDGSDGNLDITQGADMVTVSWSKFSYSSQRTDPIAGDSGHRFSNLIGASDTDTRDPGRLNVTYHHCWWADNVNQRMPRTRRGQIHVFNNLYTSAGNSVCTNAGFEARLLVQNNIYIGVNQPFDVTAGGDLRPEANVFENTSGVTTATGAGFTPPYTFALDPTADLEAAIRAGAGPQ